MGEATFGDHSRLAGVNIGVTYSDGSIELRRFAIFENLRGGYVGGARAQAWIWPWESEKSWRLGVLQLPESVHLDFQNQDLCQGGGWVSIEARNIVSVRTLQDVQDLCEDTRGKR